MSHAIEHFQGWRLRGPRRQAARGLLLAMALAGCAEMPSLPSLGGGTAAAPAARAPATPADPIAAFAVSAAPGAQQMVALPGGGSTPVRVQRAYHAASGRECRDLLIGSGANERSSLLCQQEDGWAPARPLLRGGGSARP